MMLRERQYFNVELEGDSVMRVNIQEFHKSFKDNTAARTDETDWVYMRRNIRAGVIKEPVRKQINNEEPTHRNEAFDFHQSKCFLFLFGRIVKERNTVSYSKSRDGAWEETPPVGYWSINDCIGSMEFKS